MSDSAMISAQRKGIDDHDGDLEILLKTAFKDHASQKYRTKLILYSLQQTFHLYRRAVSEQYKQPSAETTRKTESATWLQVDVTNDTSILITLLEGGCDLVRKPQTFVPALLAFECARMHVILLHLLPNPGFSAAEKMEVQSKLSAIRSALGKAKKMLVSDKKPVGNLQLALSSLELGITSLPPPGQATKALKMGLQLVKGVGKSLVTMHLDSSFLNAMGTAIGMAGDHMRQRNAAQVYRQLLCLHTVAIPSAAGDTAVTTYHKQVNALKQQIISLQQLLDGEQPRWEVVAEFVNLIGDVLVQLCVPSEGATNIHADKLYEWLWLGGECQCDTQDAAQLRGVEFVGLKSFLCYGDAPPLKDQAGSSGVSLLSALAHIFMDFVQDGEGLDSALAVVTAAMSGVKEVAMAKLTENLACLQSACGIAAQNSELQLAVANLIENEQNLANIEKALKVRSPVKTKKSRSMLRPFGTTKTPEEKEEKSLNKSQKAQKDSLESEKKALKKDAKTVINELIKMVSVTQPVVERVSAAAKQVVKRSSEAQHLVGKLERVLQMFQLDPSMFVQASFQKHKASF
jgi:hypothetical protein